MKKQTIMRSALAAVTGLFLSLSVNAQTLYAPGGTVGNITGTNVGIGTSNPGNNSYLAGTNGLTLFGINPGLAFSTNTKSWLLWGNYSDNSFRLFENSASLDRITVLPGGNVGIGTTTPGTKLVVNGKLTLNSSGWDDHLQITRGASYGGKFIPDNSTGTYGLRLDLIGTGSNFCVMNGNVGIETTSPSAKFQIGSSLGKLSLDFLQSSNTNIGWNSFFQGFNIARSSSSSNWTTGADGVRNGAVAILSSFGGDISLACIPTSGGSAATLTDAQVSAAIKMKIQSDGKVLIGNPANITMPGSYKLYVETGILAEKVKVAVKTTGNWSDYVFGENYKLKSIEELENYFQTNKHLPNIPSAEEMVKNGLDVATMDAKLLEKIEELTLYIVDLNKRIVQLEKENKEFKK